MGPEFNILISSAGRRVALLEIFRRTLADMELRGRLIASDITRTAPAIHRADKSYQVPRCTSAEFVPTMLDICQREKIRLVVPTIDTELPPYAESREQFTAIGTTVLISTPPAIAIGADKKLTHEWLESNSFPTVKQTTPDELGRNLREWSFPLIVKPRRGSASAGVAKVESMEELDIACRRGDFVVQSIAPGNEHTIDVLVSGAGRALCAVPRRRLEVRAGEVSKGVTVRSAALEDLACRIGQNLKGAYGVLTIQIFLDAQSGTQSVIEINPRFGGGFPLAWEAGATYPRWLLEEILGLPSTAESGSWRDGLAMLRYDDSVFVAADEIGV